jgi:uncharacterized OB-fold protein
MAKKKKPQTLKEPHSVVGKMHVPYKYFVGALASRFCIELRDNQKIMGIRCPQCDKVLMPPRSDCVKCFGKLDESMFVELSGKGTLTSYTVVHYSEPMHPMNAPFAYGIIRLDGADTGLTHFLGEVDLDEVSVGMKVEPVFKEKREGNILDIKYFRPS